MLLSFSVENFRSFKSEQTLSLLASKRLGATNASPHYCAVPGTEEHVLRVASLYGANGAGKSNLVRALGLVQQLVLSGTLPGKPIRYTPFLLDDGTPIQPTCFELQFIEAGEVFRYGACYDADRVHEEWLDVYEGKAERNLFTRVSQEHAAVTVTLGPTSRNAGFSQKMVALANVGARPNQLFLSEVVNLDDAEAQGPRFGRATKWFASTLKIIEADARFGKLAERIATDTRFAEFVGRYLREASTGIADIRVQTHEVSKSKFSSGVPGTGEGPPDNLPATFPGPDGREIFVDTSAKDVIRLREILALHQSAKREPIPFPLHEESDGSKRLLDLLPALYLVAAHGGLFVIDELERSMHPMLARKFVEFFLKSARGAGSQLVFTTHESTLLDLDLVRRDGIWFAEKDQDGATHLYSLADFKVRKDLRIEKGYLEGRFGAIPFLGGIDHLLEEQVAAGAET